MASTASLLRTQRPRSPTSARSTAQAAAPPPPLVEWADDAALAVAVSATTANYGTIQSRCAVWEGVYLAAGGSLPNASTAAATALIAGASGVVVAHASATIANFGTIQG